MRECRCKEVDMNDVRTEPTLDDHVNALVHNDCGGIYDPASRAVREHRNDPGRPVMPHVEYRGFDK